MAINSLSMVAEDHAESKGSATALYNVIRKRLLDSSTRADNLLPLVYVMDSILKNVRGQYVGIIERDAKNWLPVVYQKLLQNGQTKPLAAKLQKVWKTWNDGKIFSVENLRIMGQCFEDSSFAGGNGINQATGPPGTVAGIRRTADGGLVLSTSLRREMQSILDEMQSGIENELEKVSLERLADINPDLLASVKQAAEESMQSSNGQGNGEKDSSSEHRLPSFFVETRSPEIIERSLAWDEQLQKNKWNYQKDSQELVEQLRNSVTDGASTDNLYTRKDAIAMTQYLAAASATAMIMGEIADRIRSEGGQRRSSIFSFTGSGVSGGGGFGIDRERFTNAGVKEKNDAVIGMLYEVGLPFVSSADGRRFRSQHELSSHLDTLFRRNQLEKSIARTEERGWFISDVVWSRQGTEAEIQSATADAADLGASDAATRQETKIDDGYDPETSTMPADESRERCVVCGINFKMFFDNDDGIYKYRNCREIEVMNDDVAEKESEHCLVHVSCWRGLGSPDELTTDQVLHDAIS